MDPSPAISFGALDSQEVGSNVEVDVVKCPSHLNQEGDKWYMQLAHY